MDNCFTFKNLVKGLMTKFPLATDVDVVAIDLPGHGTSSHKSLDGTSTVALDFVYYMYDALKQLEWEPETVTAIGHSMGSFISLTFTAAFSVKHLIMLDSLGPLTKPADTVSTGIRNHIKQRVKGKPPSSVYPDLETAIETRCLTATTFPGNQYISKETATELVKRASSVREDGQLEFLHDQRLKWPSMLWLTDEHVNQIYQDVDVSPTCACVLLAKDGMPFPPAWISRLRELMHPTVLETLPGSHHFHADPDTVGAVVDTIVDFLAQT
jgi:pimeloyl-ACP methyl ester carboxylesterase